MPSHHYSSGVAKGQAKAGETGTQLQIEKDCVVQMHKNQLSSPDPPDTIIIGLSYGRFSWKLKERLQ
jgi:hypothetical protein